MTATHDIISGMWKSVGILLECIGNIHFLPAWGGGDRGVLGRTQKVRHF